MGVKGKDGGRDGQGVWDGHGHTAVFNMENQQGPAVQHRELCSILCNNLMVTRGKDGGRDSQGVWDGHGHNAVFNMENQQGAAGQHRELCSVSRGSLDGRGVCGRRGPRVWAAESPAVLLKASQRCSSPIQFSRLVVSDSLRPHGLQHARLPGPGYTPVRSKTLKIKRRLARSRRWAGVTRLQPTPGLRQSHA